VVTEFIEGLVETYPGLQYLDGFPQVLFRQQKWF
jgi:dihydroxyacetone kinase